MSDYNRLTPLFQICKAIETIREIKDMEEVTEPAQYPLLVKLRSMCKLYKITEIQLWFEYHKQDANKGMF